MWEGDDQDHHLRHTLAPVYTYYSKKKEEPVEVKPEADNAQFSKYELLHGILMRLSGRYTDDEIKYLETIQIWPSSFGRLASYIKRPHREVITFLFILLHE